MKVLLGTFKGTQNSNIKTYIEIKPDFIVVLLKYYAFEGLKICFLFDRSWFQICFNFTNFRYKIPLFLLKCLIIPDLILFRPPPSIWHGSCNHSTSTRSLWSANVEQTFFTKPWFMLLPFIQTSLGSFTETFLVCLILSVDPLCPLLSFNFSKARTLF